MTTGTAPLAVGESQGDIEVRHGTRASVGGSGSLPTWFVAGLVGVIVAVATAAVAGLGLLVAHCYQPAIVAILALAAGALAATAAVRRLGTRRVENAPAIVAVVLALAFLVMAASFHSEHLLTDRDPGVYVNTGRSIAGTHELHPVVRNGAFSDPEQFSIRAASFNESDDGRLNPNFFPLLPVLLALGWTIGGDTGLLVVPAVLATLGLLAAYAIASKLIGSRAALIVAALLALSPLQLWFARDAYSELYVQMVILGGLWLYCEARDRDAAALAAVAGAMIATASLARIDAVVIAAGVVGFVGVEWVRAAGREQGPARRVVGSFGVALAVTLAGAIIASSTIAHGYVKGLQSELNKGLALVAAASVASLMLVVLHRSWRAGLARVVHSRALAITAAIATASFFVWGYWIRPTAQVDVRRTSRRAARVNNHWHWTHVLHWFSAYWGFVALVAFVIGLALIVARARRGNRAAVAVCLVVIPIAVLYVARPSIAPDQPWAMRRFLPVVIPGCAIALAVVFATLTDVRRGFRGASRHAVTLGIVVLALLVAVPNAVALRPFARAGAQHGALRATHQICKTVGKDGAVLQYGYNYLDLELPQTVRGFCGVPTAKPRYGGAVSLGALASDWHQRGRRLFVVTGEPSSVRRADPRARERLHVQVDDKFNLERTKDVRPQNRLAHPQDVWVFEIPYGSEDT